jgi:hypothetical protein
MKTNWTAITIALLFLMGVHLAWKGQVAPTYTVQLVDTSAETFNTPANIRMQWADCPGPAVVVEGGKISIPRPNGGSFLRDICPITGIVNIKNP